MSNLTLIDLAQRTLSDAGVGLVEEILNVAPELQTIPVVPKPGTSYRITRRTGKPRGAFRNANEGVTAAKSTYAQVEVPMFFFDGQMVVDEAIVKADDRNLGDILADEGAGQLQDTYVVLGDQVYRGKTADSKGFNGLLASVDSSLVVDATGTGQCETVWAVYESPRDGLHIPIGNSGALSLANWNKQQVLDSGSKPYMAYVANLSFYMGLCLGSAFCVGCIKNVNASKPMTDALAAELLSKFGVGRQPTRWFMSRNSRFYLQKSRTAIGYQPAANTGTPAFPPLPDSCMGIPIAVTDSIAQVAAW